MRSIAWRWRWREESARRKNRKSANGLPLFVPSLSSYLHPFLAVCHFISCSSTSLSVLRSNGPHVRLRMISNLDLICREYHKLSEVMRLEDQCTQLYCPHPTSSSDFASLPISPVQRSRREKTILSFEWFERGRGKLLAIIDHRSHRRFSFGFGRRLGRIEIDLHLSRISGGLYLGSTCLWQLGWIILQIS